MSLRSPVSGWLRLGVLLLAFGCGWAPQKATAWIDAPVRTETQMTAASHLEPGAWDVPRAVSPRWQRVERELPMLTGGRPGRDLKGGYFRGAETAGEVPVAREFIPPTVPASWWIGVVELRL